ncbi:uncharacterized protein LOC108666410 isoform X2 [Hyalella azteca]|uniref:Probable methylthioribulose-1-phosphate dehydratase n=1 Tax=Hyalella azteca TaxID=294128 RepID=A0A979FHA8_HYAAZ|nr:uncharacterized protein LOC108666410 isoform X2 [Hyalella azteca]
MAPIKLYNASRTYQTEWETQFPWLRKASDGSERGFCTLCHVIITPYKASFVRHEKTSFHLSSDQNLAVEPTEHASLSYGALPETLSKKSISKARQLKAGVLDEKSENDYLQFEVTSGNQSTSKKIKLSPNSASKSSFSQLMQPAKAPKKSYEATRRYRTEWETQFPWLQKAPDGSEMAYCKLCHIVIRQHKGCLVQHEKSNFHLSRDGNLNVEQTKVPIQSCAALPEAPLQTRKNKARHLKAGGPEEKSKEYIEIEWTSVDQSSPKKTKLLLDCNSQSSPKLIQAAVTPKKSYDATRRYRTQWETQFPWLEKASDGSESAFCKLCHLILRPHKGCLVQHEKSDSHRARGWNLDVEQTKLPIQSCAALPETPSQTSKNKERHLKVGGPEEKSKEYIEIEWTSVDQSPPKKTKLLLDCDSQSSPQMIQTAMASKKSYDASRRYRTKWETQFPWLKKASDGSERAYCKLCHVIIRPHKGCLVQHEKSDSHRARGWNLKVEQTKLPNQGCTALPETPSQSRKNIQIGLTSVDQSPLKKTKLLYNGNSINGSEDFGTCFGEFAATLDCMETRELICELCRLFYSLGWVTGTGGGISIKDKDGGILVAPSRVQKERIKPEDLFKLDSDGQILSSPSNASLKLSQCTPLFMLAYKLLGVGAVLHSHSKNAVLATLIYGKEFRVTHLEMIKGIQDGVTKKALRYDDELVVPIIDNTPFEKDLVTSMEQAMNAYPSSQAVLVRRHGVYVWGDTWQQAKSMAECFDYLFEVAVDMKRLHMDAAAKPSLHENL